MTKFVLCFAFIVGLTPLFAEDEFVFNSTPGTLPKDIIPLHYSIEVRPDLGTMKTSGSETIALEVRRATNQIVFIRHRRRPRPRSRFQASLRDPFSSGPVTRL